MCSEYHEYNTLWGKESYPSKKCVKCGEVKPLTEEYFGARSRDKKGNPTEWRNGCKECDKKQNKVVRNLKKVYPKPNGNYQCPICHRTEKDFDTYKGQLWVLDHDHETGKYRGYICNHCNTVLARSKDNIDTLKRAIEYLENNR
jgi:hypothetical protein